MQGQERPGGGVGWPPVPGLSERVAAHLPALSRALHEVYGALPGHRSWMERLLRRMAAACAARPEALHALDRDQAPGWFLEGDAIGYSAYVDRFAGSLAGLAGRAPYLRGLGVRYLHLLPFWRARAGDNDGGFAVSDYRAPDPRLGDLDDLERLASALREAGIALCADLVLNHTADDHAWARAARAGDPAARSFYHVVATRAEADAWEAGLGQVFPETAPGNFTWSAELGGWVWTTFYPYQWDLNYANPDVFLEMAGVMADLANRGVGAFRLDSAAFLWKRLGTPCRGLPEVHAILRAFRAVMAIVAPSVLLKSEVIAPAAEAARYFGDADRPECHLAYHAGLMAAGWAALAEADADLVRAVIASAPPPPAGAGWLTYVRCHDDIGWQPLAPQAGPDPQPRLNAVSAFYTDGRSFARGEPFQSGQGGQAHGVNGTAASLAGLEAADEAGRDAPLRRLVLLHGLAFAVGGLPVVYMGDELGQLNDRSYAADPARRHEGRWLHRPWFDEAAARAGDTALGAALRSLAAARRRLPAASPATAPVAAGSGRGPVLALRRGDSALLLFNFSPEPQDAEADPLLGEGRWQDALTGAHASPGAPLPGYGMAWLVRG